VTLHLSNATGLVDRLVRRTDPDNPEGFAEMIIDDRFYATRQPVASRAARNHHH
jgi:hypothetical protein